MQFCSGHVETRGWPALDAPLGQVEPGLLGGGVSSGGPQQVSVGIEDAEDIIAIGREVFATTVLEPSREITRLTSQSQTSLEEMEIEPGTDEGAL